MTSPTRKNSPIAQTTSRSGIRLNLERATDAASKFIKRQIDSGVDVLSAINNAVKTYGTKAVAVPAIIATRAAGYTHDILTHNYSQYGTAALESLKTAKNTIETKLGNTIENLTPNIMSPFIGMPLEFLNMGSMIIYQTVTDNINTSIKLGKTVLEAIREASVQFGSAVYALPSAVIARANGINISAATASIKDLGDDAVKNLRSAMKKAKEHTLDPAGEYFNALLQKGADFNTALKQTAAHYKTTIANLFVVPDIRNSVSGYMSYFNNMIQGGIGYLSSGINSLGQGINTYVTDPFSQYITSPFMKAINPYIGMLSPFRGFTYGGRRTQRRRNRRRTLRHKRN
jgi:hypothetical protein